MKQLVINVKPDGTLETLLNDAVFDTAKLGGTRQIERISLIEFDEDEQGFYIKWLKGPYKNLLESRHATMAPEDKCAYVRRGVLYFASYAIAVEHEVARVNAMRLSGVSFDT